jgi:hypothetical protein
MKILKTTLAVLTLTLLVGALPAVAELHCYKGDKGEMCCYHVGEGYTECDTGHHSSGPPSGSCKDGRRGCATR